MGSHDAALPGGQSGWNSEYDSDQLPLEDTLLDRGVGDVLDEGYSPPERPRHNHWGETAREEELGEPLDFRLAEEEPEPWAAPEHGARQMDRAGRLLAPTEETGSSKRPARSIWRAPCSGAAQGSGSSSASRKSRGSPSSSSRAVSPQWLWRGRSGGE